MSEPTTTDALPGPRIREVLSRLPAYVPGKPAAAPEGQTAYKCSSNENPYQPLPSVLAVIREAAETINRYPDMAVRASETIVRTSNATKPASAISCSLRPSRSR